ncbi:hypothetical protein [Chitinophaga rhizosphaerae]|uniref:hypothetical protein n=1 Tax=Chitinophaga rhizosphaerae TaxID=1864947 RepID=UPI000F7FD2F4|nr:hypothetical protein [Chitinophaga rhizosphaerae]
MRMVLMLLAGVVMIACNTRKQRVERMKELSLLDEKRAGSWNMRLKYLPAQNRDTSAWTLVLYVEHISKLPQKELNDPRFSYGTDSLFQLIASGDTLAPLMVVRVANGQTSGAEYLMTFDRAPLRRPGMVQLRFRDWLFSQRDLYFPLNVPSIYQLDSINTRI